MSAPLVLAGLVKRRAQLAGDIEAAHDALRRMVQDLETRTPRSSNSIRITVSKASGPRRSNRRRIGQTGRDDPHMSFDPAASVRAAHVARYRLPATYGTRAQSERPAAFARHAQSRPRSGYSGTRAWSARDRGQASIYLKIAVGNRGQAVTRHAVCSAGSVPSRYNVILRLGGAPDLLGRDGRPFSEGGVGGGARRSTGAKALRITQSTLGSGLTAT
jgi:hypothetical protein